EIYLVGNFASPTRPGDEMPSDGRIDSTEIGASTRAFRIEPIPRQTTGDLSLAGLAGHGGTTCLYQTVSLARHPGSRVFLELGLQFDGSVSVKLNGHRGVSTLMRPVRMDVTDLVRRGKNKIEIQLTRRMSVNPAVQTVMPVLESARLLFTAS
ncbi:MAG: hypothetical protein LC772_09590, partial [Chloroflexi bacterium]|nr:hypothetical protein [Chloroflexota bacterium]